MARYSNQPWYCNACGKLQDSPPFSAKGRFYKVCSVACVVEMDWRDAGSLLGEPYIEPGFGRAMPVPYMKLR